MSDPRQHHKRPANDNQHTSHVPNPAYTYPELQHIRPASRRISNPQTHPRPRHHIAQSSWSCSLSHPIFPEPIISLSSLAQLDPLYPTPQDPSTCYDLTPPSPIKPLSLPPTNLISNETWPALPHDICPPSPGTSDSTTSSRSSSTVSHAPSADWSPVQTEVPSDFCPAQPSRGPSPLRRSWGSTTSTSSANPQELTTKSSSETLRPPPGAKSTPHICLWGINGICPTSGFLTREELNRHVKMEHLLECPVISCTETVFQNREHLDCHMRWDHGVGVANNEEACRSSDLIDVPEEKKESGVEEVKVLVTPRIEQVDKGEDRRPLNVLPGALVGDKVLKMELSIGIAKKRCREQLRTVLERRYRRANGGHSPSAQSGRAPRLLDTVTFPVLWEHGILPFLIEFMPRWCGPEHVISVTRGRKPNARRICIMTRRVVTKARRMVIAGHVRDLLPENYRNNITFVFSTGQVDRLVWARGLSKDMPDEVCPPRNPFAYISPCMGDSIGASLDDGEEATATLGPCITAEGGSYWLACFHPFISSTRRTSPVMIEHPSPQDRVTCTQERHDVLGTDSESFRIGKLTATSGYNLKTTRISHDPYWEECDKEQPLVVTDWILISAGTKQANILRKLPTVTPRRETPITTTAPVTPGANVISTGRTSGVQRGQVCEIPAYVTGAENGTGKATREWYIEEPFPYDNENEWIRGGIGVEGDSGAAIVDSDTNTLIGQLWGRNRYHGPGPRRTYFTPIIDIFDDIQEKSGLGTRPQLPQYRGEADRWPTYPICRQCFDMREYLDSRRSSRESLMSMIGAHDIQADRDNDLTSVSDLATPRDHPPLARQVEVNEAGSSFGPSSAISPSPLFSYYPAPSPGASDFRSPYAPALLDDDLYETKCPESNELGLGKRPALVPPSGQDRIHQIKRRREM
ncbi:hypothetical protein GGR57DRAFT_395432 [Xylariaceae sp. FL1272]|nr:hypothetical protein GGR57DRAFT_395432 [Xylariaceae sp. FL1272]